VHRRFGPFLAILVLATVGTATGSAQEATPAALPAVPDPSECRVEPRSLAEIVQTAATPTGGPGPGSGTATPVTVRELDGDDFVAPEGEPADAETAAAVTATLREFFACFNAGDLPRLFGLYSDDFIRRDFAGASEEELAFLAEAPAAAPMDQRVTLVAVRDVQVLDDGRVGAFVDLIDPTSNQPAGETDFFYLMEEDDRYKIDGFAVVSAAGTPAAARG
jgi:ketosteroid isomerase-like protein